MEQYNNLPGFFVDLADDGLQIMPSMHITDSVTLIGFAEKGPMFTPVRISRLEEGDAVFGAYHRDGVFNGKSLALGMRQAYGAGCRDIRLVRIPNGTAAELEVANIVVTSKGLGAYYNDIKVEITADTFKVWSVEDALLHDEENTVEATYSVSFATTTTYAELFADVRDSGAPVTLETAEGTSASSALGTVTPAGPSKLSTGEAAVDYSKDNYDTEGKASIRAQVLEAYNGLLGYETDVLVALPLKIEFDNDLSTYDFEDAEKLSDFCAQANTRESRVLGVMSVATKEGSLNSGDITSLITGLTGEGAHSNLYPGPNGQDLGKFISITVGDVIFYDNNLGLYSDVPAAAYAGLITSLNPHSATTNKVLANARGLRYSFYPAQLDQLTAARFVTFRNRTGRGVTVTDGITCAKPLSDFQRLSTLRIANTVITITRQVTEPFIGEALDSARKDSIETAIEGGLRNLRDAGAISSFEFAVYFDSVQDRIQGILTVEINIVPAFEVRKIRLKLKLTATQ